MTNGNEDDALLMSHSPALAFNRTTFGVACLSPFTLIFSLHLAGV
jgi:hypothetical protein